MPYVDFIDLAGDFKTALEATEFFQTVRISTITDYDKLFKTIADISVFPAAVVCIGAGQFTDRAKVREISPAVLVVDRFRVDAARGAAGVWDALEAALAPFLPDVPIGGPSEDTNRYYGVTYWPAAFRPVATDSDNCAYIIEFEAVEPIQSEPEEE